MTFDNNQDKDRHIAEVFVPVVEEKKLWVRLGIAKDDDRKKILKINDSERVCDVCGKAFKSGKALGGHMRIHVQQSKHQSDHMEARKHVEFKNKEKDYYKSSSSGENNNNMIFKKPICTICGKKFPSMKSLYGHMKSHPERCWRGIIPPNSSIVSKNSSSSSLSEVEQHKIKIEDDHLENLVEDEKNRRVDLIKELWGWKVRARRGRRSIDSSEASSFEDKDDEEEEEDVEVLNAANKLMLMVNGIFESEDEAENSSPESKKRGYDQYEGSYSSGDDKLDDKDRAETDFHNMVIAENKSKKKRKKVKLSDLKLGQKDDHDEDKYYKCNTCGKCFSTFQALGGHRSSHNTTKSKIVIRESTVNELDHHKASLNLIQVENLGTKGESSTTCGVAEAFPSQVESSPGESSRTCQRVLGIDLNEMPQSMDEHEA